ncbi:MAG TPA: hypothetical protein VGX78_02305, partial [Pirellulales bacterium]|nr:hypothetical protein [Pirellulales bacterium]
MALGCALLPGAADVGALAWQAPAQQPAGQQGAAAALAPAEISRSTRIFDQEPYDELELRKTG